MRCVMILVTPQCPEIQCSWDHGNRLNHGTTCCGFDKGSCLSPCLAWTWRSSTPCWECERHQFFSRTTDFCIYGALKNWTHLTHLKTSLEPVDNEARDLLETCQEDFRFVRIQLTNFQENVAGQIF